MDVAVLLRCADRFGEVLAGVDPDRYTTATPCPGWNVGDLIDHVIAGNHRVAMALAGRDRAEVDVALQRLPRAADRRPDYPPSVRAQSEAFRAASPQASVRTAAGPMTASRLLGVRVIDLVVHSWDLARAVGADERIPPDLVIAGLAVAEPQAEWMAASGVFGTGASGATRPPDDQEWLLQLTGRRSR